MFAIRQPPGGLILVELSVALRLGCRLEEEQKIKFLLTKYYHCTHCQGENEKIVSYRENGRQRPVQVTRVNLS